MLDADRLGRSLKAVTRRASFFIGGIVALGIAASAVRLALGHARASRGGDAAARDRTASLLAMPAGRWLVGAIGLAVIGAGFGMAAKAWTCAFARNLGLDAGTRRWVLPLGRLGFIARALVFGVIGAFLLRAAWQFDARQAHGLAGALRAIQTQAFGRLILTLTGVGLFAFGAYELAAARYRRIVVPDMRRVAEAAKRRL